MSNDAKGFILYLKEYPQTAAKVKDLKGEALVDYAHQVGFDFSQEEWEETYAKRDTFQEEERELPKSCGCGW